MLKIIIKKLYSSAVIASLFVMAFAPLAHAAYYPNPYVYYPEEMQGKVLGVMTGAQWYVSPNGSSSGDGSQNNPWDLQTALNHPAAVHGGDVINLRGGIYKGPYVSKLNGSSGSPIVVRSYPGEWAILDWYMPITLASGISAAATTITLTDASAITRTGANSIVLGDGFPAIETIYIKSIAGNTLNIIRGWSGTTAQSFSAGATVRLGQPNLLVQGSNTWFRDFEVTNSYAVGRILTDSNPDQSNRPDRRYGGISTQGTDVKFINLVIHDVGDGMATSDQSTGSTEISGLIAYGNGWTAPDRGHGHGFYLQNNTGSLTVSDTMSFNNHATGEKVFGYAAHGNNVTFDGYVGFGNQEDNFFIGTGLNPISNLKVRNSYIYSPPVSWGGGGMVFGWSGVQNNDVEISNNYIAGRKTGLDVELWQQANVTGNTIWVSGNGVGAHMAVMKPGSGKVAEDFTWDNNTYFDNDIPFTPSIATSTYNMSFPGGPNTLGGGNYNYEADWKRLTPYDKNSSYTHGTPGGVPTVNSVFVRPNSYESGRANIIVYNWTNQDAISANVSGVLSPGDAYEVRDAQNYFGSPITSGTYSGGSISIPMTGLSVYQSVGTLANPPQHTPKEFGTFVIRKTATAAVAPAPAPSPVPPTPGPTPTPTSPTPTPTPLTPTPTPTPNPPSDNPTSPIVPPAAPADGSSSAVKLINNSGTYYLIIKNQRHGITNPGMLNSYGFRLEDAKAPSASDVALPESDLLLPGNGSLVKSKEDPTVYLISKSKRYAFTSAKVFQSLGFKFSSVLVVTNPELQVLSKQPNIDNGAVAHLPGTDINRNGTVYWIAEDNTLHAYPSLEVYNSWHIQNDFSRVVPSNPADQALNVGEQVSARIIN